MPANGTHPAREALRAWAVLDENLRRKIEEALSTPHPSVNFDLTVHVRAGKVTATDFIHRRQHDAA